MNIQENHARFYDNRRALIIRRYSGGKPITQLGNALKASEEKVYYLAIN